MKPKGKLKPLNRIQQNDILNENDVDKLLNDYQKESINLLKEYSNFSKREFDIFMMAKKILMHNNDIIYPQLSDVIIYDKLNLNTWFTIAESIPENFNYVDNNYELDEKKEAKYKCKRIELDLTEKQKQTINIWLNAYSDMYNIAIKHIKNNFKDDKKVLNFFHLRSLLKDDKDDIVEKSKIKVHDIDFAIKLACENYKSALANLKKGFIKEFRVRYWRKNKSVKIMDLEKDNFKNNSIRKKVLGEVKGYYNGNEYNFDLVNADSRLQKNKGKYYLFVPELLETDKEIKNKNKQITIDPGIRTFGTGITENKIVKIGDNIGERITEYLFRKDNIKNNENISKKIKNKNEKIINKKIDNLVIELHWKTINYLTENYETILIGNMSSKSIIRKGGNISKLTKRIASSLSFYKFHKKLKYKCDAKGVNYGKINEWMTSRMCSICGNVKEDLGKSKVYNCSNCGNVMERDVNGARCINIKAII